VEGDTAPAPRRAYQVRLGTDAYDALALQPGSKLMLHKTKKPPFWSTSPRKLIAEPSSDPALASNIVVLPKGSLTFAGVRAGDTLVAATPPAARSINGPAEGGDATDDAAPMRSVDRRHRRGGWGRAALWWALYGGGPRYGYGYRYNGHGGRGYSGRYSSGRRGYYGGRSRRR